MQLLKNNNSISKTASLRHHRTETRKTNKKATVALEKKRKRFLNLNPPTSLCTHPPTHPSNNQQILPNTHCQETVVVVAR